MSCASTARSTCERFEARFRNAREFAVRWRNKCHDGRRPPTNTLADYLALIGYRVPERAGPGRVGETIEILQRVLLRGRRVSDLTDKQLRRWDDLREHNRHDCTGMRQVTILAADEIAEEDRRAQRSSRLARKPRLLRSRAGAA